MDASVHLLHQLYEMMETARDEIFINEYAITHFTYRTNQLQQSDDQPRFGNLESHRLQNQEAEYILYGFASCQLNLGAAQTEMFLLRTAMRTLEAVMEPKSLAASGTPPMLLFSALMEGAKQANEDVNELMSGKAVEVPFIPGLAMDYKDHLRLFYVLHSRNASLLSRMQALIELNTGIDLMSQYTALHLRLQIRPPFWFLRFRSGEVESVISY